MHMSNERTQRFREAIAAFINGRREAKLKGVDDEQMAAKYDYTTWLASAAQRVRRIQMVTHPLKATFPDAHIDKTTSLYRPGNRLKAQAEIGSHSVLEDFRDVTGDAAVLDVYKFLKIEIDGKQLIDWFQEKDADLFAALHSDPVIAQEWAAAFKALIRTAEIASSHLMAKQLYWCVGGEPADDAGFHLLQPLFSSSLAHAVHLDINTARFGDASKAARQAKRNEQAHEVPYADYRNLIARKLGGTKPQNISQLNSDRGGVNYLLASLPPQWNQDRPKQFLFIDSALERFRRYENVDDLVEELCRFLQSNPDPTMETRIKRERIEQALGQALAAFGMATQQLFPAGWSRDDNCKLPLCQQLWLDPERAELPIRETHRAEDEAFIQAYEWKDWPDEVAHRFGNWLNDILHKRGLPVGDAEHAHWAKQAIIDAEWPATMQRRAIPQTSPAEVSHG